MKGRTSAPRRRWPCLGSRWSHRKKAPSLAEKQSWTQISSNSRQQLRSGLGSRAGGKKDSSLSLSPLELTHDHVQASFPFQS